MRATEASLVGLLALTLAGSWLRAEPIAERPLWYDEAASWSVSVHGSYGDFFAWRSDDPKQPPLSFLLTKATTQIFGSEREWVLRLPSLLAGILCIPAAFWLGWSLRGPVVALLAALLVTFDPNMVSQSQQSRMYTLLMLATLAGLGLGLALLRDPLRWGRRGPLGLGVLLMLGLYANQLSLALWAGIALAGALLLARERPGWNGITRHPLVRSLGLAYAVAVLLSLPGLVELAQIVAREWNGPRGRFAFQDVSSLGDLFGSPAASGAAAVLAVMGLVRLAPQRPHAALLLAASALTALALLVPFRLSHHFFDVRFLGMLQPSLWLGLACLPVCLAPGIARFAASLAVLCLAGVLAWQSFHIESWWPVPDRFAQPYLFLEVAERRAPADAVLLIPGWYSVLGRYYGVEQDPGLKQAWHRRKADSEPEIPAGFAAPTTWILGGFLGRESSRTALADAVSRLAAHYRVPFDPAPLDAALATDTQLLVRISGSGIELQRGLPLLRTRALQPADGT